jgi:uncharacterized membrane protein YbjE (DUF340 family)
VFCTSGKRKKSIVNPLFIALFVLGWMAPAAIALTLWALAYRFKQFGNYVAVNVISVTLAIVGHITVAVLFFSSVSINTSGGFGIGFGWFGFAATALWTSIHLPFIEYERRKKAGETTARVTPIRRAS